MEVENKRSKDWFILGLVFAILSLSQLITTIIISIISHNEPGGDIAVLAFMISTINFLIIAMIFYILSRVSGKKKNKN